MDTRDHQHLVPPSGAPLVQWLEYAVANGVARVRFPDGANQTKFEKFNSGGMTVGISVC